MQVTPPRGEVRVPTRRTAELILLVFAIAIVFAAEAIVEATRDGRVNRNLIVDSIVPLAAGVVAHLVIRRVAPYADPLLLPIVVLLNGLGLVMIHRLDLGLKQQSEQNGQPHPGSSAPSQVLWTAIGLAVFLAVLIVIR